MADIDNSNLYRDLDVPIIKIQPTNSSQKQEKHGYECQRVKSLCRTKQSREIWDSYSDKTVKKWGFSSSNIDNRVYFLLQKTALIMLAIVFDGLDFSSNSMRLMKRSNQHYLRHSQPNYLVNCGSLSAEPLTSLVQPLK